MRPLLTLACVLWLSAVASAQTPYVAADQITVTDTAGGFTAATINQGAGHPQANYAICRLETADIRVLIDGNTPTSTVGTQVLTNDTVLLGGNDILNRFKAIRSGSSSGVLNCTYLDARPPGSPAITIISAASSGAGASEATLLGIEVNTNDMLGELQSIHNDLGDDWTEDAAPLALTGPGLFGVCDDTGTNAVDESDAGSLRINCTTRALITEVSGGATAANQSTANTALSAIQTAVQLIDDDQTGASMGAITSAASTNATTAKGSAGRLLGAYLLNNTTTIYYIRFYNLASAPTCSSATGYVFTLPVPPAGAAGGAGGFSMPFNGGGLAFSTGVSYCITGGPTSTDNTNAAVGIYGVLSYK